MKRKLSFSNLTRVNLAKQCSMGRCLTGLTEEEKDKIVQEIRDNSNQKLWQIQDVSFQTPRVLKPTDPRLFIEVIFRHKQTKIERTQVFDGIKLLRFIREGIHVL